MPVALLSLLLGIRAEKKIGPRSHLAAAQKRAGPYHGAPAFFKFFFLFDSSRSQTNSDMSVLLELLLAKSLGITSNCSLRQTTSCKCCAASWASTCCSDLITAIFLSCLTFSVDRDGIFCFCFFVFVNRYFTT